MLLHDSGVPLHEAVITIHEQPEWAAQFDEDVYDEQALCVPEQGPAASHVHEWLSHVDWLLYVVHAAWLPPQVDEHEDVLNPTEKKSLVRLFWRTVFAPLPSVTLTWPVEDADWSVTYAALLDIFPYSREFPVASLPYKAARWVMFTTEYVWLPPVAEIILIVRFTFDMVALSEIEAVLKSKNG